MRTSWILLRNLIAVAALTMLLICPALTGPCLAEEDSEAPIDVEDIKPRAYGPAKVLAIDSEKIVLGPSKKPNVIQCLGRPVFTKTSHTGAVRFSDIKVGLKVVVEENSKKVVVIIQLTKERPDEG